MVIGGFGKSFFFICCFIERTYAAIERFSFECLQSKMKVIILANHRDTDRPMNQSKLKASKCSRRKARENMYEQITIGFGFTVLIG